MTQRIMLVDDERGILNAVRRMLEREAKTKLARFNVDVEIFESPFFALKRAGEVPFAVVISDYRMPTMNGVEFLTRIKALQPSAARLILSGDTDLSGLIAAINDAQIQCFLGKPWVDAELRAAIVQALEAHQPRHEHGEPADDARIRQVSLTAREKELKQFEERSPVLARVNWTPDGGVLIDPEEDA